MTALRPQTAIREIARLVRSNVFLSAANFATSLLLARLLGAERRGELAFLILWSNTIATLVIAGLPLYFSRLAARTPADAAHVYGQARRSAVVATAGGWVALSAFAIFAHHWTAFSTDAVNWISVALLLPLSIWMALQLQIEVGRGNLRTWIACLATFAYAQLAGLMMLAALDRFEVWTCLASTLAAAGLAVANAQIRISRSLPAHSGVAAEAPWWRAFVAARRDNAASWLSLVASNADRLVVSLLFPAHALADYVVLSSVAHLQNLVCEAIAPAMFADVAGAASENPASARGVARRLRQTVLVSLLAAFALAVAMPYVVPLVYGPQYGADLTLIVTITAALSLRAMMRPFEEILRAKDRALEQSLVSVSVVSFFAVFSILPAVRGSLPGVAIGMLLANAFGLGMMVRTIARRLELAPTDVLVPRPADLAALLRELWSSD